MPDPDNTQDIGELARDVLREFDRIGYLSPQNQRHTPLREAMQRLREACQPSGDTEGIEYHGGRGYETKPYLPSGDTEQEKRCPTCESDDPEVVDGPSIPNCPDPFHDPPEGRFIHECSECGHAIDCAHLPALLQAQAEKAELERSRDRWEHLYQATNNAYGDKSAEAKGYKAERDEALAHIEQVATELEKRAIKWAGETGTIADTYFEAATLIRHNPQEGK